MKNFFIKFKETIINFLKGIVIGIAMIVPGVSGGTLALTLGIYSNIIDAVNGLFKHFIKSIKYLFPIILGVIVGFISLVIPIRYGLEKCPLIIILLFTGLIIGSIPSLYKKVSGKESIKNFSLASLAIFFMIGTCFLVSSVAYTSNDLLFGMNFGLWMYLFLAGIIIAAALVMPGISGSMMLMVMGLYLPVLDLLKGLLHGENILATLIAIIPVALGVLIGFFLISFIMGKLLKKCEIGTYFVIIGLIVGSIGTIFYLNYSSIASTYNALHIIVGCLCFIIGFSLSFGLDLLFKNISKKKELQNNEETISDETR